MTFPIESFWKHVCRLLLL